MIRTLLNYREFYTQWRVSEKSWLKEISKIKPKIQSFKKFLIGQFKLVLIFWQALFTENSVAVMLVTSFCWQLYDGGRFEMLVAKSFCWRFFKCIKSVSNNSGLSPTHLVSNFRSNFLSKFHKEPLAKKCQKRRTYLFLSTTFWDNHSTSFSET